MLLFLLEFRCATNILQNGQDWKIAANVIPICVHFFYFEVDKMTDFFEICVNLAQKAAKKGEVPIGAIVVKDGKIIAKSYNLREKKHDITAHAEVLAIKRASKKLHRWNLSDCELYVTLKPCSMCASIIKQSRILNVYYLYDKQSIKKEYDKTNFYYKNDDSLTKKYGKLLSSFFLDKR